MHKNKKIVYYLTFIPLIIFIALFVWLLTTIFEGEKPYIKLDPLPKFISGNQEFSLRAGDEGRGLKSLRIFYEQGGSETTILEKNFSFVGLFNEQGTKNFETTFEFNPAQLRLAQGQVNLKVQIWDYSRRGGGDGNMSILQHSMTVDTIPPSIRAISRMHNVNMGGAGLVVYRTSSDTVESDVFVNDRFAPGFPATDGLQENTHVAYFGLPFDVSEPEIYLWAKDRAGNEARSTFYYHIRQRRFPRDNLNITDNFLRRVLPYFDYLDLDPGMSDLDKYILINNELRVTDDKVIFDVMKETSSERYWEGTWLRLRNAATMAQFADHRSYMYRGEKIDEQYHMGVDLASLANAPVEAANNGRILFAGRNGIYGLTVIIDHGQGLASLYGHLSEMTVVPGDLVNRGDIIGNTGQTGLAGGDHLHFSVIIHDVFVNPIEWWDPNWIRDNITGKLDLIELEN